MSFIIGLFGLISIGGGLLVIGAPGGGLMTIGAGSQLIVSGILMLGFSQLLTIAHDAKISLERIAKALVDDAAGTIDDAALRRDIEREPRL